MVKCHHGAPSARRWGRILLAGVASCALAACATTSEGGNPPKHCSRGSARNANPYGSIFSQADVSAAPAPREGGGAEVMVFSKDAEPAPEAVPVPDLTVPPPAPRNGAPAPVGRPLSMGRDPISPQSAFRSC